MNVFLYFWLALKASLFSTGGSGNIPSLHTDLVDPGWATEEQFGESIAVGMISPGPSGLWVVTLGYLMYGMAGALASVVAILIPPFLVIPVEGLYKKHESRPAVEGFVRGLGLAVVGVSFVVLVRLLAGVGLNVMSVGIALGSIGLGATRRVPVPAVLALGAVAEFVFRR